MILVAKNEKCSQQTRPTNPTTYFFHLSTVDGRERMVKSIERKRDNNKKRHKGNCLKLIGCAIFGLAFLNLGLGIKYNKTLDHHLSLQLHKKKNGKQFMNMASPGFGSIHSNLKRVKYYEMSDSEALDQSKSIEMASQYLGTKEHLLEQTSLKGRVQSNDQIATNSIQHRIPLDESRSFHSNNGIHDSRESHNTTTTTTELPTGTQWQNSYPANTSTNAFPNKFSSLDELLSMKPFIKPPQHLHLVFAGDSLTRYQYLSLVYFLKFDELINPTEVPNMVREKEHATWFEFFKFTNAKLKPYEQCDCFRPEGHKMPLMLENRYFYDPDHNNSISFIQKFGHKFTFKSNWNATDVHNEHKFIRKEEENDYVIDTLDWPELITDFISKLDPKPRYFVFNQGIHPHRDFTTRKNRRQIIRAIKESGMVSIYKTTTKYRDHDIEVNEINETTVIRDYEIDFCNRADYCIDSSWTWMVSPNYYSDYAHFVEPIYAWQNVQLFDVINSDLSGR